ncbi:MAG: 3-deoxy-manno-octulosonate-8-phosphatase KdsC [Pseudomonadota bacterium]|jgi:3-deoxy-D-manno-octulosonate 8-phosphate phosphatase (KDO 8-P phosphatase)|uniref:3-deoxy-D-manno-octulosonate 8-phosphate phosphatase KdsC n=1 Tax=Methylophaga thalassica TaxID=40223 RepID=A0ABQ5TX30_9GAMM|nr:MULTISPECIES: 3-deoxy-manno-octulosonate-8-phosphatase KdsC [Methylophaga]MEC9412364.1 3-deoxy-manno-octulosonate-8-phosphatase KdsC [Pseudomonadota bacterium]WVI85036.1 3-deoxy-manno-octulosonate-8-phosphatase KdsC [Methylophaga thalassica]GLQ00148.1 3-deoxy-D-manno-octulosonate 8-phosphate phosphatase [Methylophaga thalassica]HIC45622.1 3-deoxy-manno-octulosonate-8-phosphatase KdsC [Methylophaga sp.]HIM38609.1 3-deoxy-manno-octulosonate-8-phosphatase KdsC [Methylophaga aminisulfidivorans]
MQDILEKAKKVKLVVFDVDGVLTNGQIIIGDNGEEYKAFHSRDGHGMKLLQYTGVEIAIITGRTSRTVEHRMQSLGIKYVYQGQRVKLPVFQQLIKELKLSPEQCAYVGDDWVDLSIMSRVGLAIAVQDADPIVKKHAHFITTSKGGHGAAREVCELIMEGQGNLQDQIERHF